MPHPLRSPDDLVHPRDLVMQTMERIYRYRMTTTSGGNISLRDDAGDIWITPARVDKGSLTRNDIVCVRADGTRDGIHVPSSEFPFHRAIYQARPDLKAIVHAHPVALVAFSIVGKSPNTRLFHQAWDVCGSVGFAPYALPGSEALGANIAKTFAEGFDCVVLENHGVVVGADTLTRAFERFETLEFTAKTIIKASLLGEVQYLDQEQLELPRGGTRPLPEFDPAGPTSVEKELRRRVCEFVRRGYQQRLMISTAGSFSCRVDDRSFLITPSQYDRRDLAAEEIALVSDGNVERGKQASRATRLHHAIYQRRPEVGAIVNAYPVNATAFGVTRAELDARTIPESYILLRSVQRSPCGLRFQDSAAVANAVSMEQPIMLLENDGVLACGRDVLDAFDRLEVLECTAEAIINSRPLGPLSCMPETAIDDLTRAFLTK